MVRLLYALTYLIEKHAGDFSRLESIDSGKPTVTAVRFDFTKTVVWYHFLLDGKTKFSEGRFR